MRINCSVKCKRCNSRHTPQIHFSPTTHCMLISLHKSWDTRQANKANNYLTNVECCFSERLESTVQKSTTTFSATKYRNLEENQVRDDLLKIQIGGERRGEAQFKIIGKPACPSLERDARKTGFKSLSLFSVMDLDFCGPLLHKPGHSFKFNSQFTSTRTFQSLNFSHVPVLWSPSVNWCRNINKRKSGSSKLSVLQSQDRVTLKVHGTSFTCHCTSPYMSNNWFFIYEK